MDVLIAMRLCCMICDTNCTSERVVFYQTEGRYRNNTHVHFLKFSCFPNDWNNPYGLKSQQCFLLTQWPIFFIQMFLILTLSRYLM